MKPRIVPALVLASVALGCGSLNALVGGDCPDGLVVMDGRCVPDPTAIADGGSGTDGSFSLDGSVGGDGSATDGSAGGDGSTNGDGSGGDDGSSSDGASTDADGGVVSSCDKGLTLCDNQCVDTQTDPYHCGGCGSKCPTLLCAGGVCQGALNGHVVLIGHDYSGATSASQERVLANAALIPSKSTIRVRAWEPTADPVAVNAVRSIIQGAATAQNRSVVFSTAMLPADVLGTSVLTTDVLLLEDQPNAAPGTLGALGTTFAATLATFTKDGGVVVITDGGSGAAPQMSVLVKNAGLLDVTGEADLTFGTSLGVTAPADAVGLGVLSPYAAGKRTVRFTCNEPNAGFVIWVVVDPSVDGGPMAPVVVHKVIP